MNQSGLEELLKKPIYTTVVPENEDRDTWYKRVFRNILLSFSLLTTIPYCVANVTEYSRCREGITAGHPKVQIIEDSKWRHSYMEKSAFSHNRYRIGEFTFNLAVTGRTMALLTK